MSNKTSGSGNWNNNDCEAHENEMIKLLQDAVFPANINPYLCNFFYLESSAENGKTSLPSWRRGYFFLFFVVSVFTVFSF